MSRYRMPSTLALVFAAVGLAGGLVAPTAMAAFSPAPAPAVTAPSATATLAPSVVPFPGAAPSATPSAPPVPVRITAALSRTSVTYGTPVTLSGTLLHQPEPGSAYVPFPGEPVAVYSSLMPLRPVATPTTDASGDFRLSLPAQAATTTWTIVAGAPLGTPAEGTATQELTETVSLPTAFSGFSVSLDQYGQLAYSGCLNLPAGIPVVAPVQLSQPAIQYAAQPTGPWHTLTSAALTSAPCGNGGEELSGRVTAPLNLAYYRAYFPGSTAASGTGYLESASPAAPAWKFADRITSFGVSQAIVGEKDSLTVRGTLQYYYYGWHGYAGQAVLIILRPKGQGSWYWIRQVTTGPGGRFSVTYADPLSATWSAEYLGDGTHLATVATMIYVRRTVTSMAPGIREATRSR